MMNTNENVAENTVQAENLLDATTRNKLADRVEVLDKVKELFLLPQIEMMTTEQVSNYYEVESDNVRKCYQRNKAEIDFDGTAVKLVSDLKGHFVTLGFIDNVTTFDLGNGVVLKVPNRGIRMFSKRAILRIGMLLRDSTVAREVRTQLLNTFEHATEEQRTEEIKTEKEILANYGWSILYGTREQIQESVRDLVDYKDRHTNMLKEANNKLNQTVAMLTHNAREWKPRDIVNRLCRYYAVSCLGKNFGGAYNKLYQELLYKKNIALNKRNGGKCALDRVKAEEWDDVVEVAAAMCIAKGIDVASVINEVNALEIEK